jgi:hypothetical protein
LKGTNGFFGRLALQLEVAGPRGEREAGIPRGRVLAAQGSRRGRHVAVAQLEQRFLVASEIEGAAEHARAAFCLTRASSGRASSAGTGW